MESDKWILAYFLPSSSRSRSLALAVSGALAVGLGGYLIYKNLAKSLKEASLGDQSKLNGQQQPPVDPHSSKSDYNNSPNSKVKKSSSPRSDLLAKAQEIKLEGNELFKANKFAEAIKCYDEAIEICPKERKPELATFYQNRAAAYEKLNELEKAYEDCTAALKLNQRYVKALYRRADLCEKLQRVYEAMQDFMKCCILENFNNPETSKRADTALRNLAHKLAKEYMQTRGDRFLPFSHCTIKDMLHSYACDPVITPHLKVKGANAAPNAQSNAAASSDNDDYSTSLMTNGYSDSDQDEPLTGYRKAIFCLINRQYDRIIDACTEEIDNFEQSTHYIHCLLLRSTFYYFKGQFKKAEADLSKVFDILKDKETDSFEDSSRKYLCAAHIKMSLLEHQKGNVDECLAHLTKAEKIMPQNPDVYSMRGQVYSFTRDYAKANVDFARCVQLRPDFAHFAVQLATAELKTATENNDSQSLPQIIRNFEDLVRKFADSAEVNLLYAQVLCDAAQFDTAVKYFDKAQKLDPNNPNVLAQRALLEIYFENQDGCLKLLDQALKLDPYCMMALEIEAQHHSKRNDVPKMMESYEKALQMARNETEVAHFIAMRETTLCQIKVAEEMLIGG